MTVYSRSMTNKFEQNSEIVILIPARLASTRLPNKPLALIADEPMIVHVWRRALEADLGRVVVAAAETEIATAVDKAGGEAVLTDPELPSGSDRIFAALNMIDPDKKITHVINLQGDLPVIEKDVICKSLLPLQDEDMDMATLVCPIKDEAEMDDPNVVKAIVDFEGDKLSAPAVDFCRELGPSHNKSQAYHHIGIYAYRRTALEKFVGLDMSSREKSRRLEQMRALDNGMTIGATCVDTVPRGVDTPADLDWACTAMKDMKNG